jgi:hypothetical protein
MIAGSFMATDFGKSKRKDVGTKPEGVYGFALRLSLAPDSITAQRPIPVHRDNPVKLKKLAAEGMDVDWGIIRIAGLALPGLSCTARLPRTK